jgi:hypothetical protein
MEGQTRVQIGEACGVSEKTIDRDIGAWVQSGLFDQWLKEEFVRLHPIMVKTYPELVYKELARLMGKMFTRKIEVKEDYTETKNLNINLSQYTEEDKIAILDAYRRINKNDSGTSEPIRIH